MTINEGNQQHVANPVPFARSYQLEALEMALKQNTIVYFETGTGKTLIAIMLLRSYAHLLRKPSPNIAVFLVPTVVLVTQQCEVVRKHTDLTVGEYYGEMGVDYWDASTWKHEMKKHEVLVMTPQILLDALRHKFMRLDQIKVLIFDECHKAKRKHQYACIMTEFYHRELACNSQLLPRVFGMTASPIMAKAAATSEAYWKQISELENLMHSKVFTCDSESVLAPYVTFSTPKIKKYNDVVLPHRSFETLDDCLRVLVKKHEQSLRLLSISEGVRRSTTEKLKKAFSTFMFCLTELGVWLASKAAEVYSHEGGSIFIWGSIDVTGDKVVRDFSCDVANTFSSHLPCDSQWSIRNDLRANMSAGYLTSKIMCLIETLLEYRELKDLRCIVFVERIVTAIVIRTLLNELLLKSIGWKTEYTAGNNSKFHSQSRKEQNAIIDEFRNGTVNIIIATSMLEEGLDVQSCNLVIRFDPSATICSFIQSRGRARMQNSDFVIMVKSGDHSAIARVNDYLAGGHMMRKECLSHGDLPCEPLDDEMYGEPWYEVESTGAIATLSSSVAKIHFYCSRLPSDRYFKPYPRFTINKELGTCTLQLPSSCPIQTITVEGNPKLLKQLACLEACKKLHEVGALTDHLVPDIVEEEAEDQDYVSVPYGVDHAKYISRELVGSHANEPETRYYCYSIDLQLDFQYDVKPQGILLAVRERLDCDLQNLNLGLEAERGKVIVSVKDVGYVTMSPKQVVLCQKFQVTLFWILLRHELHEGDENFERNGSTMLNYLLLPSLCSHGQMSVDWKCIDSVSFAKSVSSNIHTDRCSSRGAHRMHTKNGLVCNCALENALVCTPHNSNIYCIKDTLDGDDGNSNFTLRDGESITYKNYYYRSYGINLQFEWQPLLYGKRIFTVHNFLLRSRTASTREQSKNSYKLPPELCSIIMSPISISAIYSFSFLPSIMHWIESLLLASNLRSVPLVHSMQNVTIPTIKVLEAITSENCQETLHLESLETLGDSFLKYAASQQLFKTYENGHEGLLSLKRKKIISNVALCRLGCDRKIPGFIRNEPFDPKTWIIPGSASVHHLLEEEQLSPCKKIYIVGSREVISENIADVVEALIGAFLSAGGEIAALSFMSWLGINVDLANVPCKRTSIVNPDKYVNVLSIESLLKYKFQDTSLLVEALTHGSYMRPEVPVCYQRLEFLGDAVLDYLVTLHLYHKYLVLSPRLLTDLRSATVNNDCYAQSAIKAGLHKHILHFSHDLHRHMCQILSEVEESQLLKTFGWESETEFPKVLDDVIESLAGAIYIDSGGDKERVFQSMRPLLEPLVTLETLRLQPKRELNELCQKMCYGVKKPAVSRENGVWYMTVEVEADGYVHRATRSARNKKMAERLACKDVLKAVKKTNIICT